MLALLVAPAIAGLVLAVAARRKAIRWLGAGLCALSLLTLIWLITLIRADGPPDPLPDVRGPATILTT